MRACRHGAPDWPACRSRRHVIIHESGAHGPAVRALLVGRVVKAHVRSALKIFASAAVERLGRVGAGRSAACPNGAD